MSQRVRITRVKVRGGKPYLGTAADGSDMYSDNPGRVMRWLCDAWRCRFNQCRSVRKKHGPDGTLIPIGNNVVDLKDSEARARCPWLQAVPKLILQSPGRIENMEWWASVKRRKTARKQHQKMGCMPRFRSRKRSPLSFVCWHNKGVNANYRQANRKHGIVTITGQNPAAHRAGGVRWRIEIHVRISQPIRDYTSVIVNWSEHALVFSNPPQPLDVTGTHRIIGIDRGAVHQAATSDGELLDLPKAKLMKIDREIKRRQRAQARKAKTAGYGNMRDYLKAGASKRYRREQARIHRLYRQARNITVDWVQKTSTRLIRENDVIVIEDLNLTGMMRTPKPKSDGHGGYKPNGRAAKRGLNRVMLRSSLGLLETCLDYKIGLLDGRRMLVRVNPAYTSRTCAVCGYCDEGNRESQAVFRCKSCGHTANADLNAAVNILIRGVHCLSGMDDARQTSSVQDVGSPLWTSRATLVCEPRLAPNGLGGIPRL